MRISKFPTPWYIVLAAIFTLLQLIGCSEDPTSPEPGRDPGGDVDDPPSRNLNTDGYFEEAISLRGGQREFFSWIGTRGSNGIEVHINVHDGNGSVPSDFNRSDAKAALINARNVWVSAIRDAGIDCQTVTRFESEGDAFSTREPYIDVNFLSTSGSNNLGGVRVRVSSSRKTFDHVYMEIATGYDVGGSRNLMSRDDYYSTLAHEFGHAFGIYRFGSGGGHSPNVNDVMYGAGRYWTLSKGDNATIRKIVRTTAYYKPNVAQVPTTIQVRHSAARVNGSITVRIRGRNYEIQRGQTRAISLQSSEDRLDIWECVGSDCRWDRNYTIHAGGSYEVVDVGRALDMTLRRIS